MSPVRAYAIPTLADGVSPAPGHGQRLLERAAQPLGDRECLRFVGQVLEQHRELVAAEAGGSVLRAERLIDAAGDCAQQLIADGVTEPVVDGLEVVQVEEDHRDPGSGAPEAGERMLHAILEQCAVREPGEPVVESLVMELLQEPDALGHVADVQQDPVDQRIGEAVVGDELEMAVLAGVIAEAQTGGTYVAGGVIRDFVEELRGARRVVGVHELRERPVEERLRLVAQHPPHRFGQPADAPGRVDDRDDVRGVADQGVHAQLAATLDGARLLGQRRPALKPVQPPAQQHEQHQADGE